MKHAHAGLRCELGEFESLAVSCVEQTSDALHELDLRVENSRALWLAAQASAKAGLFRSFGQVEEADALSMCTT